MGWLEVIGINPEFEESRLPEINLSLPDGCTLRKEDIISTGLADESISAIFSVSVFEHLVDFHLCLSEMYRMLTPGGYVYAEFGPIWSSSLGHHVHATIKGEEARHWDPIRNPVPNYGHLLMQRDEMLKYLREHVSDLLANECVNWIYDYPHINRLFLDDYLRFIDNSKFEVVLMEFDREHVPAEKLIQLRETYPQYRTFDVRNIMLVLRKYI
jgi:SAM-dependent methyltransferase